MISLGNSSSELSVANSLNGNSVVTEPCLVGIHFLFHVMNQMKGLLPFIGLQRIVVSGEHLILLSKYPK